MKDFVLVRVRALFKSLFVVLAMVLVSVRPTFAVNAETELRAFAHDRLVDAILLYDQHFRVAKTGQYRDAIQLDRLLQPSLSSTASTGMGLISLAMGDALGVIDDAEEKAEVTLLHLLGRGTTRRFKTERSKNGWFRHWFDARTGAAPYWNEQKFSIIDTAILGAGAAILHSYLLEKTTKAGKPLSRAGELAHELVMSVDWTTAIRNPKRGSIHLILNGIGERPSRNSATIPFDEYAILPCMAASYEKLLGTKGPATKTWKTKFSRVEDLPMKSFENFSLIGKSKGSIPSHFTHQFAFHLCGAYARDPVFVDELAELMAADKSSFEESGGPVALWGLGAGSELVFNRNGAVVDQRYAVSRLAKNEHSTASPAIMAGFLAVDEERGRTGILSDLTSLWAEGHCRYEYAGLEFMWRCAPRAPKRRVTRVEGVDFSTWMFGLATAHPKLGLRFFQRHAF